MLEKLGVKKLNEIMTLADKISVGLIIVISLGLIGLTPQITANETANKEVVVTLDDKEIYEYPLEDTDQEKNIKFDFTVEGKDYQGVLRMKEGRVKLERLSEDISPLPIHANMGWISKPHQMIVCMPIKLSVTIRGGNSNKSEEGIDVKTY
jgi:hypothetical protein